MAKGELVVAQNSRFNNAQVLGIEVEADKVEATTELASQEFMDGVADLVGVEHLASVFFQNKACADFVPIVIGVFQLVFLWTAEVARVGLGQEGGVIDGHVTLLSFKDLFITAHQLMLAVARQFVESQLVLVLAPAYAY